MDAADAADPGLPPGTGCVFGKALLAGQAGCECARRSAVGERLVVECVSPPARTNCATLLELLRERSRFALKLPASGAAITHLQSMRLQCGGLMAMQSLFTATEPAGPASPVGDVHRLLLAARDRHASLTELPWATLVRRLAAWQPARRRVPRGGE